MLPLPARGISGDRKDGKKHRGLGYAALLGLLGVAFTLLRSDQNGEGFLSPLPAASTPRSPEGAKMAWTVPTSAEMTPASALVLSAAGIAAALSLRARERRTRCRAAGDKTKLEELTVGQEVTGKVTRIAKIGVWVDIGTEKDGLIPAALLEGNTFKAGDSIAGLKITELQTGTEPEDRKVRLAPPAVVATPVAPVPKAKAKAKAAPKAAPKAAAATPVAVPPGGKIPVSNLVLGTIVEGTVNGVSEFGVFVDIGSVKDALIPARSVPSGQTFQKGDPIKIKIIQLDSEKERISASLDLESFVLDTNSLPKLTLDDLKVGAEVDAVVLRTAPEFGAFLEIGWSKPALCRLTQLEKELSAYKVGDKVKAKVLAVDQEGKVLATLRPLSSTIKVGQTLEGTVKLIADFGIFFDAGYSADVLAPESALSKSKSDYTQGTVVDLIVTRVDGEKVSVSTKSQEELGKPASKFRAGAPVTGTVKSISKLGLFIDIGSFKDGLLRSAMLPKPVEDYKKGDVLTDLFVLKIDQTNQEIELGSSSKPVEGSNMARLAGAASMPIGTIVSGKVTGISEVGVFVDIGSDRDALYGNSQLDKPKSEYKVGDLIEGLAITQNEQTPRRLAVSCRPTAANYKVETSFQASSPRRSPALAFSSTSVLRMTRFCLCVAWKRPSTSTTTVTL